MLIFLNFTNRKEVIPIRLWHYQLIPGLPDKMLIAQWRECIAIKRQWEKGTLKHRLVSYVMDYDKMYFGEYVNKVISEMEKRNIIYNKTLKFEIYDFCCKDIKCLYKVENNYPEHNNKYLKQCYYNLQEKYDRGILTREEFNKVFDRCKDTINISKF